MKALFLIYIIGVAWIAATIPMEQERGAKGIMLDIGYTMICLIWPVPFFAGFFSRLYQLIRRGF